MSLPKTKLVKIVICKNIGQARRYLDCLPEEYMIRHRDLLAYTENGDVIQTKVFNSELTPLDCFGCGQYNSIEFLTFDFGEKYLDTIKYLTSRLRSIYEAY